MDILQRYKVPRVANISFIVKEILESLEYCVIHPIIADI